MLGNSATLVGFTAPTGSSSTDPTTARPGRPILDFSHAQGDWIVTSDGNDDAVGFQAFRFIGKSWFTGVGQPRWCQRDGDTIVQGNTGADPAGAELRLMLDPLVSLQASDLIFSDLGFATPIQA